MIPDRHHAKLEKPSLRLGLGLSLTGGGFRDTWQTAYDAAYAGQGTTRLRNWFAANTGHNVSLTGTLSGTQSVTTQAAGTALLGKTITGTVNSNGVTFNAGEAIELSGFKVVSPALTRASSHHCTLLSFTSSAFTVYAHHITLDGQNYTGSQGTGGNTFADNITFRYLNIYNCGFDGLRMYKNTLAEYIYVHDLLDYDAAGWTGYDGNGDQDLYPHLDALQPQHTGCVIRYSWLENNTGSSATSGGMLLLSDVNRITSFTMDSCYISGGANHCITVGTAADIVSDPGVNGYPEGVVIQNCVVAKNSWLPGGSNVWSTGGTPSGIREDTGTRLITSTNNRFDDGTALTSLPTVTTPKFYHFCAGASGALLAGTVAMWGGAWTQHPAYSPTTAFKFDASGRVYAPAASNCQYLPNSPTSADYKVGAYFIKPTSTVASDTPGICLRMDDTANTMYQLRWKEAATSRWEIRSIVAGVATVLGTYDDTFAVARTAFVEFRATGTTLDAYIDGTLRITVTDSAISAAGHPGILFNNTQTASSGVHMILLISVAN